MKELNRKTECLTDSVIRRMTRISMECGAINLSQGFPDFDPPEFIMKRLAEVATAGPHQYTPTWGAANYRAAIAEKVGKFMGLPINPDENVLGTVEIFPVFAVERVLNFEVETAGVDDVVC